MLSARFEPKSIANIPTFADIGKFYISIYCFHALLKNWGRSECHLCDVWVALNHLYFNSFLISPAPLWRQEVCVSCFESSF